MPVLLSSSTRPNNDEKHGFYIANIIWSICSHGLASFVCQFSPPAGRYGMIRFADKIRESKQEKRKPVASSGGGWKQGRSLGGSAVRMSSLAYRALALSLFHTCLFTDTGKYKHRISHSVLHSLRSKGLMITIDCIFDDLNS